MAIKLEQFIIRYKELTNQKGKLKGVLETLGPISNEARDYPSDPRNFKYSTREWAIY